MSSTNPHGIDRLADTAEFAFQWLTIDRLGHSLRKVARGYGADDACHFDGRPDQITNERIDRLDRARPAALRAVTQGCPLAEPALAPHGAFDPR